MFKKSLFIAFAAIGTQATQLKRPGLAQLEDEKIDAIADQIGALSVEEMYDTVSGLFAAQLDAKAENSRSGAEVLHSMVDDAVDMYNYASS